MPGLIIFFITLLASAFAKFKRPLLVDSSFFTVVVVFFVVVFFVVFDVVFFVVLLVVDFLVVVVDFVVVVFSLSFIVIKNSSLAIFPLLSVAITFTLYLPAFDSSKSLSKVISTSESHSSVATTFS
ncbi:MAG: hypothetical protein K2L98_04470 [Bacilli bacterium]|nr:hypothetical protein [Bacilli bacterium]